ncbi:MAG TPA: hypothetical protein VKB12_03310, partial [Pyrinomonadaceae bacterium]|nr:hypothetical protein [Pyrinomonadaceae bacterium]
AASKLLVLSESFGEAGRREESLFVALKAHALAPPDGEAGTRARVKLCTLGAGGAVTGKTEDEYAYALARELSDAREPEKLFKDDPKGDTTLDSLFKTHADWEARRAARNRSNFRFGLLTFAAFVFTCFALQRCGGLNTRPSRTFPGDFPAPTYTPFQMNLNYNYNLNIKPYPIPTPLTLDEPGTRTRGRKRRPRPRDSNTRAQNDNALKLPPPAP